MENYYSEILATLSEKGVRFVVAGGVAVVMHGVQRMTIDLDLAVEMTSANLGRFVAAMSELNMTPRVPVPIDYLLDANNRKQLVEEKNALVFSYIDSSLPLKHVDIFLTNDLSYDQLIADAVTFETAGHEIKMASIEKILELKRKIQPPRPKDILDITELTRILEQR